MNHPQADRTAFWMRLSRDRFVRLILALLALLVPLYTLPLVTPQQREKLSSENWIDVLLILVSLAAFVKGLRRATHLEGIDFGLAIGDCGLNWGLKIWV